ncbi:MAG: dihydrofolate reductase family protein [Acidimicrobiales bacterium]
MRTSRTPGPLQRRRLDRGQRPRPRMAVVSGRLDLDPASPLFTAVDEPTLVCTSARADPTRRAALAAVGEVVTAGVERVEPGAALAALAERGASVVLVEGGPSLNAQMFGADLVDEVCLTVAPLVIGGRSARITAGELKGPLALELVDARGGRHLFLHHLRRR